MTENVVIRAESASAAAMLQAVGFSLDSLALPGAVREREKVVPLLAELTRRMLTLYERERDEAVCESDRPLRELQEDQLCLNSLFQSIRHGIFHVGQSLDGFAEQTGRIVKGRERLSALISSMDALIVRLNEEWPVATSEEMKNALMDASGPGGALELDEAFAQIAGVDAETWRQRVMERLQQRS